MAVLINGMEMSMHCMDCPFMAIRDNYECILQSAESNESFENLEQMKVGCPLVPVPPHGDLIGRDAAAEKIWDDMRFPSNLANAQFFVNELREMPTIIPASEEGE